MGDGCFFCFFFQLPEYLPRPLSFSAAKTKRLELTGNLSRFSLFLSHGSIALFLHRHRHLQRLSIKLFYFCYFTFFLPLSLHSTKILWFCKSTSLWISPGCVCVPLCGASWACLEKKKMVWQSSTAHSVPKPSAAFSRSLSRASRLRAHLHLSLMTQTLFRWHHAEYKMSI